MIAAKAIRIALFALPLITIVGHVCVAQSLEPTKDRMILRSPDENVTIDVHLAPFSYSVAYKGQPIIADAPLGLDLKGQPSLEPAHLESRLQHTFDTTTTPVWGKTSPIRNHFNEMTLSFQTKSGSAFGLILRAYDDGAALRYTLPSQSGVKDLDRKSVV